MTDAYSPATNAKMESDEHATIANERPWQAGIWRRLPWTGLLALLAGLGCGITALTVALISDGKPLDFWSVRNHGVQPTVILAVLTTLANALLGYALTCGLTISWWTGALQGRTLRHLHTSQSQAMSLIALLTGRPKFNAAAMASLFVVVLLMDQPLFQRGIRVVTRDAHESKILKIPVSSSPLQEGATGLIPDHSDLFYPRLYHPLFSNISREYDLRDPIKISDFACEGKCDTEIVTAGWDVACNSSSVPYRLMNNDEWIAWSGSNKNDSAAPYNGPARSQNMFNVSATYGADGYGIGVNYHIKISTIYKATLGGNGTLRLRDCVLSEALVRYPIHVDGETVSLRSMPWSTNSTVQKLGRSYEETGMGNTPSTLGGVWLAVSSKYRAQANLSHVGEGWNLIDTRHGDSVSSTYLRAENMNDMVLQNYSITWADPTDDIISMAHELMLRTAIATTHVRPYPDEYHSLTGTQPEIRWPDLASVNRTLDQRAVVARSYTETVYKTQVGWVTGASTVVALACISIIPTYWGWWNLGRPVTMSPIEIAKAFDAPLLRSADPNGTADDHLKAIGKVRVCYGFGTGTIGEHKTSDVELQRLRSTDRTSLDIHTRALQEATPVLAEDNLTVHLQQPVPTQRVEPDDDISTASAVTSEVDGSEAPNGPAASADTGITNSNATSRASVDNKTPEPETEATTVTYRLMFRRAGHID